MGVPVAGMVTLAALASLFVLVRRRLRSDLRYRVSLEQYVTPFRLTGSVGNCQAASQSQYRVCARFLRNAKVRKPATAANSVDCHRWFARDGS